MRLRCITCVNLSEWVQAYQLERKDGNAKAQLLLCVSLVEAMIATFSSQILQQLGLYSSLSLVHFRRRQDVTLHLCVCDNILFAHCTPISYFTPAYPAGRLACLSQICLCVCWRLACGHVCTCVCACV